PEHHLRVPRRAADPGKSMGPARAGQPVQPGAEPGCRLPVSRAERLHLGAQLGQAGVRPGEVLAAELIVHLLELVHQPGERSARPASRAAATNTGDAPHWPDTWAPLRAAISAL